MTINFIFSAVLKDGKLCMGNKEKLLFSIRADMNYFKSITMDKTVVMGINTWNSLVIKPLCNRKNIIISNNIKYCDKNVHFMDINSFKRYLSKNKNEEIFCIGGSIIFNLFMKDELLKPDKIFITHMKPSKKILDIIEYDTVFDTKFFKNYRLFAYSNEYKILKNDEESFYVKYRFLQYRENNDHIQEYNYISTLENLINREHERPDRTKIGVKSIFSKKLQFDISNSIPLLTTKHVSLRNIIEELLWFCRGETDSNILKRKNINIWNGNTSREFLNKRGLDYKEGELGPLYGFQLRNFGGDYPSGKKGFDQLKQVEHLLKTDPFSRRIIITFLNPMDYDKAVLLPCHNYLQFYVEEEKGIKYLSCFFNMRSSDFALAGCYNIVSYTVLTYILAARCNMKPRSISYHAVDCHVYLNHIEGVQEQIKRDIRPSPSLELDDDIKDKEWEDINFADFDLVGYFPNPLIRMPMAI